MIPEVAVIARRAAARRAMLDGLLDAIPTSYWEQRAPGDAWSVRNHLEHVATADRPLLALLEEARRGTGEAWLGGPEPGAFLRARDEAMTEVSALPIGDLRDLLCASRAAVETALATLPFAACECAVRVAGAEDRWGMPVAWPLRTYLASWAGHDGLHEAAIRNAITSPPDLVTIMQARRGGSG